ncbi:MAG: acyl-ACP--UDP-N-acetylglucosamine O-acyltransferase [Candidatus Eisenbacteria bacterium]|nr:acyl-ACP--UDP-N-acetylglucosamine O-acyltransferase [Candidatus Eisenbacteria bacterium]
MPKIDPSARVSLHAELADDVRVGPWCIVGRKVRLASGCVLDSNVLIDGDTHVGPNCRFHHGAAIGTAPQDLKYRGAPSSLIIGSGNVFRECSTVNRATGAGEATRIGDSNLIMSYAHIAHNCVIGSHVILANSANVAGHVEMGDYAIVGGVTPVHQFVKIGAHSIIGGGCRVPKDVVPYVRAAGEPLRVNGLNSIGLQRRGFGDDLRSELKKAYRIFFRKNLLVADALARIRSECKPYPEVEYFCSFVERSERGITR